MKCQRCGLPKFDGAASYAGSQCRCLAIYLPVPKAASPGSGCHPLLMLTEQDVISIVREELARDLADRREKSRALMLPDIAETDRAAEPPNEKLTGTAPLEPRMTKTTAGQGKVDQIASHAPERDIARDAARLQFLEDETMRGMAPNLVFDDDGHWCVSYTGIQPMLIGGGQGFADETVTLACIVEPHEWRPSLREAIDAAMQGAVRDDEQG